MPTVSLLLGLIGSLLLMIQQPGVPEQTKREVLDLSLQIVELSQATIAENSGVVALPEVGEATSTIIEEVPKPAAAAPEVVDPKLESFQLEKCDVARDPKGIWQSSFWPNEFEVGKGEKEAQEAAGWTFRECKVETKQRYIK